MCLLKASLPPLTPLSAFYPSFQWLLLADQREVGRYGRSGAIGRASWEWSPPASAVIGIKLLRSRDGAHGRIFIIQESDECVMRLMSN